MPYPEYKIWQLFYLLEPWGTPLFDSALSQVLAMLHNTVAGKGKARPPKHFLPDRLKQLLSALQEVPEPAELSREELVKQIKKDFGMQ